MIMKKTMRSLRFESHGPPSVLSIQELALPDLKPGEALIEVYAASINPSDVKIVAGALNGSLPRTPGRDFAGVVVSGDLWQGKEVWGSGAGFGLSRDGSHAQYLILPSEWLSEKPSNLSMEQAAAVGVPYVTAWTTLVDAANIQAGETVLITGALGAVGRAATQVARWKQAKVIGADISDRASEADAFIDTRNRDLPSEVKALTDGKGVSLVLDTVGGPVFERALKSLAIDGRQVAITSVGTRRVEFDLVDFYHNRQRLIGVDTLKLTGVEIARIMDGLREGFEKGNFQPSAVKTWSLDHAVDAYSAVERGDSSSKHILLPRPT
jgi:NADPH:quinone reductase-like Zn-dependent oxidoreductase